MPYDTQCVSQYALGLGFDATPFRCADGVDSLGGTINCAGEQCLVIEACKLSAVVVSLLFSSVIALGFGVVPHCKGRVRMHLHGSMCVKPDLG